MKKIIFIALAVMIAVAACVPPGQINRETAPGHMKQGGEHGGHSDNGGGNVNVNINAGLFK